MTIRSAGRALAALLLAVSSATLAIFPAGAVELKLSHFMPPTHPMDAQLMRPFAEEIAKATSKSLEIRLYPAGELGKGPEQQYKRAVTGISDIAFGIPQYTPTQFPRLVMLNAPGLFQDSEKATSALWTHEADFAREFGEVKLLAMWFNEPTVLITKTRPVRTLADMKGLKVRAPDPVTAKAISAWGGIPVSVPATETYSSLSNGLVDAVMIAASGLSSFKLAEVGKHVTVNTPATLSTFFIVMNKDSFASLSPEHRAAIDKLSGRNLSLKATTVYLAAGKKALDLAKSSGLEMISLDAAAVADFNKAMRSTIEDHAKVTGSAAGFDGMAFIESVRRTATK
jgi:TRAP-type C4-dicarboxylate transport system substrate-binding protein